MATFDLSIVPTRVDMKLSGNTGLYPSGLIASAQTVDRQGDKWKARYTFNNLHTTNRAQMLGLIASLRGQSNRIRLPVHDNPKGGTYGGTPLVDGASQSGYSLLVKGAGTVTDWIKFGDYFSVIVNGEPELKMATADASSSAGAITLNFVPKLRASPADSAAIYVEDGVLSKPKGIFLLASGEAGWSSTAWINGQLSSVSLDLIEDVFATQ